MHFSFTLKSKHLSSIVRASIMNADFTRGSMYLGEFKHIIHVCAWSALNLVMVREVMRETPMHPLWWVLCSFYVKPSYACLLFWSHKNAGSFETRTILRAFMFIDFLLLNSLVNYFVLYMRKSITSCIRNLFYLKLDREKYFYYKNFFFCTSTERSALKNYFPLPWMGAFQERVENWWQRVKSKERLRWRGWVQSW